MGRVLMSGRGRYVRPARSPLRRIHREIPILESYGAGASYKPFPTNARDRFLLALAKHGLGRKDMPPSVSFFKRVIVKANGALHIEQEAAPGAYVEASPPR